MHGSSSDDEDPRPNEFGARKILTVGAAREVGRPVRLRSIRGRLARVEYFARQNGTHFIRRNRHQGERRSAAVDELHLIGRRAVVNVDDRPDVPLVNPCIGRLKIDDDKRMFGNHADPSG